MVEAPREIKVRAQIAAMLLFLASVLVIYGAFEIAPMPELRAELSYSASVDPIVGYQSGGSINITGWISNYGDADANVTVHLSVSYGTGSGYYGMLWIEYDVPVGLVPKNGGRKWFEFDRHLNPFDPTTATFSYSITATR